MGKWKLENDLGCICPFVCVRGHVGTVGTHSPPTSEVGGSKPEPYVGKLGVAY